MTTKTKLELLPNEIFIECFQYLNAPDIFHSFDRLNYRFYRLIRNIPLHLNFQQLKKPLFKYFCQTILSNPEIKQNIISLQLSDEGTRGQIQSFLSLFSLNEFLHLRSLSLVKMNDDDAKQVLPMLSFLSDLYCLSYTGQRYTISDTNFVLSTLQIRILTITDFSFDSTFVNQNMSLISLTISLCGIIDLCSLLKCTSMLKYVRIERLYSETYMGNILDVSIGYTNAIHLKQLLLYSSNIDITILELLLKHAPNLEVFVIYSGYEEEMIDAKRWQHLIQSSLPHLRVFKFHFSYDTNNGYNEMLIKFPPFQTDFWCKQHHWYINCTIDNTGVKVYTIPYLRNDYTLSFTTSKMQKYSNTSLSYLNEFDNVKDLCLCTNAFRDDLPYYFRNVQSLLILDLGFFCCGHINKKTTNRMP